MEERTCFDCMFSDEWDMHGNGMCYKHRYKSLIQENGVCRHHRYDEEDTGDPELLFMPQSLCK